MEKIRIVAEMSEDIFDELCSYNKDRVDVLFAESADEISREDSAIGIPLYGYCKKED